jgi:exodeoxyribonuclease VII large subunit
MHIERGRNRLEAACHQGLKEKRRKHGAVMKRLQQQEPHARLRKQQKQVATARQMLLSAFQTRLNQRARRALDGMQGRLRGLNPTAVLERGYALARMSTGEVVTSAQSLHPGDFLTVQFHDGEADSRVERLRRKEPRK